MIYCSNLREVSGVHDVNFEPYFYIAIVSSVINLPLIKFKNMKHIKLVDFSANNFLVGCHTNFGELPHLEFLNLGYNVIHKVRRRCFGSLKVNHISFEMNSIEHIASKAFFQQTCTISINFNGNPIEHLSMSSFLGLHKLKHLNFLYSSLKSIDRDLVFMTSDLTVEIDSILFCCKYKSRNMWCNTKNHTEFKCRSNNTGIMFCGLISGTIDLIVNFLMCLFYLRTFTLKLMKVNPLKIILIGMHISGALYGISIILSGLKFLHHKANTSMYIILAKQEISSSLCVTALFLSINSIFVSALIQTLISVLRYEAIKNPFDTLMKSSNFIRNAMIVLFLGVSIISATLVVIFLVMEGRFDEVCSLVSMYKQQKSKIIYSVIVFIIVVLYASTMTISNALYILLIKETVSKSFTNNITATKRITKLAVRTTCILAVNDIFWITSGTLILSVQYYPLGYDLIFYYLSILIPIHDLLNVLLLSKLEINKHVPYILGDT